MLPQHVHKTTPALFMFFCQHTNKVLRGFLSQAIQPNGFVMFFESQTATSKAPSLRLAPPRQSATLPVLGYAALSSLAILSQPHIIKLLHASDSYIISAYSHLKITPKPPSVPPTPTQPPLKSKKKILKYQWWLIIGVINKTLCKFKLPPLLQGRALRVFK